MRRKSEIRRGIALEWVGVKRAIPCVPAAVVERRSAAVQNLGFCKGGMDNARRTTKKTHESWCERRILQTQI
jgi:hypothetical protein